MISKVKVPEVGESIIEVTISRWMKSDGEYVEVDDLICEIESDKAALEIPADKAGRLKIAVKEGETIPVGTEIAQIDTDAVKPSAAAGPEATAATPAEEKPPAPAKAAKVSPVAAKILNEAGLTADHVVGTGQAGRITKQDAITAIGQLQPSQADSEDGKAAVDLLPPDVTTDPTWPSGSRGTHRERLSTLRRTIARRLVAAKNETAMLTTFNEADLWSIKEIRAKYKEDFKKRYDIGLGFMSFFTRAVCIALKEWPVVNAIIDGDDIEFYDYCDIGIAVSTPRGLVVPVIRNAEGLGLADIEKQIALLAQKARDGKLSIEEMSGGTFTITNGGVFGSMMSTPILNAPQSAILGMHNIIDRPVALAGEIVIRPMMYLALSYDHRIIDGRESVGFLYRIKELLEDPHRMLLEL